MGTLRIVAFRRTKRASGEKKLSSSRSLYPMHNQMEVRGRARRLATGKLIGGGVRVEQLSLPRLLRWSRRVGVARSDQRGKNR